MGLLTDHVLRRSRKRASASADALREAYQAEVNADITEDEWERRAWVRDVRIEPNELIVEQEGALYRVPWSGTDGAFTFGERVEVAVTYTDVAKALRTSLLRKEEHTGAMVALMLDADTASKLAVDGGEPAEDLHVTLAYLGEASELGDTERLVDVVRGWAAATAALTGEVSGIGAFAAEQTVTYASVDIPDLAAARQLLVELLEDAGYPASADHGFTPHITLAYEGAELDFENVPLSFGEVTLALAGERQAFALGAEPIDKADVALEAEMWKADAEQIVYGVVLQPGVRDSQGDVVPADEIRKAAHRWLVESRKSDVQHDEVAADIKVVESYVANGDTEVAGRPVLDGSWVIAVKVEDPEVWAQVRDDRLTGFSIGGSAIRNPDSAEA